MGVLGDRHGRLRHTQFYDRHKHAGEQNTNKQRQLINIAFLSGTHQQAQGCQPLCSKVQRNNISFKPFVITRNCFRQPIQAKSNSGAELHKAITYTNMVVVSVQASIDSHEIVSSICVSTQVHDCTYNACVRYNLACNDCC